LLGAVDKVEATDRYTVKVSLKEPYVWFPDIVANPMTGAIVAREAVDKFGDLRKWEATVGTGPWMLDSYSTVLPAVWDPALKNYGPNLGYDYGGRLMAAGLDR
jgi:ABC-type transport system substrate-binding protein